MPIKVPAGTARVLAGYGYIQAEAAGWRITDHGRDCLERQRRDAEFHETNTKLPRAARAWADRVVLWMLAHETLGQERSYTHDTAHSYAAHVVACDFAEIEPAQPRGRWTGGSAEYCARRARSAATCLKDYDDENEVARQRGVGVTVAYKADKAKPHSQSLAAERARQDDATTDLTVYRARRAPRTAKRPPAGGAA